MFGKVFVSIFDGSLHGDLPALVVMQALITLANRHGEVDMTPEALAARTSYPLTLITEGLASLAKPDKRSRSKAEQGRRIVPLDPERDWGWRLVNYQKYRLTRDSDGRREYMRNLMRERRAAEKANKNNGVSTALASVSTGKPELAKVDVEVDVEVDKRKKKKDLSRASRFDLPSIPDSWKDYCKQKRPDLSPTKVWEDFSDYWTAKAGAAARKQDWAAAWRYWVRNQRTGKDSGQTALDYLNARGDKDVS